jgi:hypothetical protein
MADFKESQESQESQESKEQKIFESYLRAKREDQEIVVEKEEIRKPSHQSPDMLLDVRNKINVELPNTFETTYLQAMKTGIEDLVSHLTKDTKNDKEVFENILTFLGKKNDESACDCGSGMGICCMDCNH